MRTHHIVTLSLLLLGAAPAAGEPATETHIGFTPGADTRPTTPVGQQPVLEGSGQTTSPSPSTSTMRGGNSYEPAGGAVSTQRIRHVSPPKDRGPTSDRRKTDR